MKVTSWNYPLHPPQALQHNPDGTIAMAHLAPQGLLVNRVAPTCAVAKLLKAGDVLLSFDKDLWSLSS